MSDDQKVTICGCIHCRQEFEFPGFERPAKGAAFSWKIQCPKCGQRTSAIPLRVIDRALISNTEKRPITSSSSSLEAKQQPLPSSVVVPKSNECASLNVPGGFEAAHEEWLKQGGDSFRKHHYILTKRYYATPYWSLVRKAVLAKANWKCFRCGGKATQVHHLDYGSVGEDHLHPEKLSAICRPCHGLVEYAREAQELIHKISRRISLCEGFIKCQSSFHPAPSAVRLHPMLPTISEQNPIRVYTRLLEYQDDLKGFRKLYDTKTYYRNPDTPEHRKRSAEQFTARRLSYHQQAATVVESWEGTEIDKAERIISLLKNEITNCKTFAALVLAPVVQDLNSPQSEMELLESHKATDDNRESNPT